MWKWSKFIVFFLAFWAGPAIGFAQNCLLTLEGKVTDSGTSLPLEVVSIYVEETKTGTITDSLGLFRLEALCPGEYHLVFTHLGCEPKHLFLFLTSDTTITIGLDHTIAMLEGIVVIGATTSNTLQNTQTLNEQTIADRAEQSLGDLLESISGVSTLRTGSGISKPVVHGLYGNRLVILNNGISQGGQQWGNDHSPEIDPLAATRIQVIKGVGSLEYPGSSLGGVILVEPGPIEKEPHLHGKTSYFFESNGLSVGTNLQLQQYHEKGIAWRINGTLKKTGDRRSANYFLTNTGQQEANLALQLEKAFSSRWLADLYFSSFNTELGILRGAHVGSLTDLEDALQREEPLFTESSFSYQISAPRQVVNHHLLKIRNKLFLEDDQWLELTLAAQLNDRREYDVRRSGRSDIPALSLRQYTWFVGGNYQKEWEDGSMIKAGLQLNITDNTNNPETEILPLIPDYLQYESAAFVVLHKQLERSTLEWGGRYTLVQQNAVVISQSVPRELLRFNNTFHNFSSSAGWKVRFLPDLSMGMNIGIASRNPMVNELYSNGLHQGVSGIEEGDYELESEISIKSTLSLQTQLWERLSLETLIYYQQFDNFIYLDPQDEIRLTIRGAFPVFRYAQTAASIYGLDVSAQYAIADPWQLNISYSYLKGQDRTNAIPLVNMPANNLTSEIKYLVDRWGRLENLEFSVQSAYVFEQSNLLPEQDFVLPPVAYHLLGFSMASEVQLSGSRLRFFLKVDNALNVAYRDYLNRQRYFADDLGFNLIVGGGWTF